MTLLDDFTQFNDLILAPDLIYEFLDFLDIILKLKAQNKEIQKNELKKIKRKTLTRINIIEKTKLKIFS